MASAIGARVLAVRSRGARIRETPRSSEMDGVAGVCRALNIAAGGEQGPVVTGDRLLYARIGHSAGTACAHCLALCLYTVHVFASLSLAIRL